MGWRISVSLSTTAGDHTQTPFTFDTSTGKRNCRGMKRERAMSSGENNLVFRVQAADGRCGAEQVRSKKHTYWATFRRERQQRGTELAEAGVMQTLTCSDTESSPWLSHFRVVLTCSPGAVRSPLRQSFRFLFALAIRGYFAAGGVSRLEAAEPRDCQLHSDHERSSFLVRNQTRRAALMSSWHDIYCCTSSLFYMSR